MDGIWYRRCPRCENYMKKHDPRESAVCPVCGWEQYRDLPPEEEPLSVQDHPGTERGFPVREKF